MLKQQLKTVNVQLKQATTELQEQKDQAMQLKCELGEQKAQVDSHQQSVVEANAQTASAQRAHARVAQQLEQAQAELSQQSSQGTLKVRPWTATCLLSSLCLGRANAGMNVHMLVLFHFTRCSATCKAQLHNCPSSLHLYYRII